ncbi:hypothetical protein SCUP234_09255 [Seiridium cupressi]
MDKTPLGPTGVERFELESLLSGHRGIPFWTSKDDFQTLNVEPNFEPFCVSGSFHAQRQEKYSMLTKENVLRGQYCNTNRSRQTCHTTPPKLIDNNKYQQGNNKQRYAVAGTTQQYVWKQLLPDDPAALRRLDTATVQALKLTCPKYSNDDREKLESLMNSGDILQGFTDSEKDTIYGNILSIGCTIPSLHSFFKDLNYLMPCAQNLRVAPPAKGLGRRLATIIPEKADSDVLCGFATLAFRLGFRNNHIKELKQRAPDRDIARDALLRARKPTIYEYEPESFVPLLEQFEKMADTTRPRAVQRLDKDMIWKDNVETSNRNGHPYAAEHVKDRKHLFWDVVAAADAPISGVTSLFVRRCIFMAFLDRKQESRVIPPTDELDSYCTDAGWARSDDGSLAVKSSDLALVRTVSTCDPDEISGGRIEEHPRQRKKRVGQQRNSKNSLSRSGLRPHEQLITFVSHEGNEWRIVSRVPSDDPSIVKDAAATYMAHRLRPFSLSSSRMRPILPEECYGAAMSSSGRVIVLVPVDHAHITRDLRVSAEQLLFDSPEQNHILEHHPLCSPRSISDRSSVYSNATSSTILG